MAIADMDKVTTDDIVNLIVGELMTFDELGHRVEFMEEMKLLLDDKIGDSVLVEADSYGG